MECDYCESLNLLSVHGHCQDRFTASGNGLVYNNDEPDYVPDDIGIGGGDDIQFTYCLICGKIQGEFPINPKSLKAQGFNCKNKCHYFGDDGCDDKCPDYEDIESEDY